MSFPANEPAPVDRGTGDIGLDFGIENKTQLSTEIGWTRSVVADISRQVDEVHHDSLVGDLRNRGGVKARQGVRALLDELAVERGMAWADIARLTHVSVSAVRKWRKGGDASPEKRQQLAVLAAFLDILSELPVEDPAQWMEVPLALPEGYSIRPFELYERGYITELLDIAGGRRYPDAVLDEIDPSWRETRRSSVEIFQAHDGQLAMRARARD